MPATRNNTPVPVVIVDRAEFQAWLDGTLMDFRHGSGIAPNELLCQQADEAAQAGLTVGFTVAGRLVSITRLEDDGIVEVPIDTQE
jgi:hypothetical protein